MNRIVVSPSTRYLERALAKSTGSSPFFHETVLLRAGNAPTLSPRGAAGPAPACAAPPRALSRPGHVAAPRRVRLARQQRPRPGGRAGAAAARRAPSAALQVVAERLVAAPGAPACAAPLSQPRGHDRRARRRRRRAQRAPRQPAAAPPRAARAPVGSPVLRSQPPSWDDPAQ